MPGILEHAPVIPVVVLHDPADAVPLAQALVAGGVPIIELTLRTPTALESMRRIAAEVPEIMLGAGTVLTPGDVDAAASAGAKFLVSPGATPTLLAAMAATGLPYLPGVTSPSEVMMLREGGLTEMKFFPAEAAGAQPMLRAIQGPLPEVRFCPTGGITAASAASYLALPNVGCVGGSWITPSAAIAAKDWTHITQLAIEATKLR